MRLIRWVWARCRLTFRGYIKIFIVSTVAAVPKLFWEKSGGRKSMPQMGQKSGSSGSRGHSKVSWSPVSISMREV